MIEHLDKEKIESAFQNATEPNLIYEENADDDDDSYPNVHDHRHHAS